MEEEDKTASQFLAMHAKLHPPDGVDEIHPRAGALVFECQTRGSLLCHPGEFSSQRAAQLPSAQPDPQRCCVLLLQTYWRERKDCSETSFTLLFFGVGSLNDFRAENAEMSSGDKACLTMYFITAFAICKLGVWFSLSICNPVLAT